MFLGYFRLNFAGVSAFCEANLAVFSFMQIITLNVTVPVALVDSSSDYERSEEKRGFLSVNTSRPFTIPSHQSLPLCFDLTILGDDKTTMSKQNSKVSQRRRPDPRRRCIRTAWQSIRQRIHLFQIKVQWKWNQVESKARAMIIELKCRMPCNGKPPSTQNIFTPEANANKAFSTLKCIYFPSTI